MKLCEAQEELRAKAGKPKWLDPAVTDELDGEVRRRDRRRGSREQGLRDGGAIVEEIVEREAGTLSMDSTEDDIVRELQVRMSLAAILEKKRSAAVEAPVREQFEDDLRALTEAEQDSKELKSAKQHLLYDRIVETVDAAVPGRPAGGEPASRTA